MPTISKDLDNLIEEYKKWKRMKRKKEEGAKLHVNEVASRMAIFYERIRNIIDWKEEHLMKRIAIKRILARRLLIDQNNKNLAEPFVLDLIRGGHFPNNKIPKYKIPLIQKVIDKYTYILKHHPSLPQNITNSEFCTRLLGIAVCEIEEVLDPVKYIRTSALTSYMEKTIRKRIIISERFARRCNLNEQSKSVLLFINVQQALMNYDKAMISYNLFKAHHKDWFNISQEELNKLTKSILDIFEETDNYLNHPAANKFYNICYRHKAPFILIDEIIAKNPTGIRKKIEDLKTLHELVEKTYNKKLKALAKRKVRSAVFSTISIFLTNVFSLYILEIPFTKYFTGHINTLAAIVDITGPTFLMFISVATVRLPKEGNFDLVIEEIKQNSFTDKGFSLLYVDLPTGRSRTLRKIFHIMFYISFVVILGTLIWLLTLLNYPPLSFILIIMFTSLISFAAVIIRKRAKELNVYEEKDSFFQSIIDIFALPIISVGRWLSKKWGKINIVAVIFNFLIDTPFLTFIEVLEQWRTFIQEKKEDIK
ncbi:hypothetical protein COY23_01435 [bacterium (Candidatus Torokbacteria) CG_4_10_14_0_2_um_filter_35_8]|nr:MAG: hypothetical protein COY23_01435 [bacterium (Candidatus Torokbacteria) CG_4_10_14_0_2_um_filter_35_8]